MPIDPNNIRDSLDAYHDDEFPDSYVDPAGCCWDTAKEMLANSDALLGLCGCGYQTEFDYVLCGLELMADKGYDFKGAEWDAWWGRRKAKEAALFGNERSAEFFYKWLDREGLAEHGSSVPGWLTKAGERLLSLMREAERMEGDDSASPRPGDEGV